MGKLIVIEGLDGSGKATQTALLSEMLSKEGVENRRISFPDYDDPSSALVKMYLGGELGGLSDVSPYSASLFYTVDRCASYLKHWKQDYLAGKVILSDRYATSNVAHQMSRLPRTEWDAYLTWLFDLEYHKVGIPEPDLVLYLDMDPEVSRRLISQRYHGDETRRDLHEADFQYLLKCRDAALYGAQRLGWQVIPCSSGGQPRAIEQIAGEISAAVRGILSC